MKSNRIKSSWNPANTILENFEDYEMKKNPTKIFRNLAPTSFIKPSEWKKKENNKLNSKSKISKKALEIIEKNKKKQLEKNISIEIEKLDNTFEPLKSDVKTDVGKFYKSLKCLEFFHNKKDEKSIIDIWLSYIDQYSELASNYKKGDKNLKTQFQ